MLEFSTASYWKKNEGVYAELIVKYNSNPVNVCVCVCVCVYNNDMDKKGGS